MKARILMLVHQRIWFGGTFLRAISLAKALAAMDYDVTLIASRGVNGRQTLRSDWHGVHLLQMPDFFPRRLRNAGFSPIDLIARVIEARRGRYDLIHAFDHRPSASVPAMLRMDRRVPFVSDWADLWGSAGLAGQRQDSANWFLSLFDDFWEPSVRRQSDAVTAISTSLQRRAVDLGIPRDRVRLVQVGANNDIIRPAAKSLACLKYGIPATAPVVAYCGFASFDAELLAETLVELDRMMPGVYTVIAGERMPILERAAARQGFSPRLIYLGVVPYEGIGDVLACGDLLLLPCSDSPVNAARFPNRFGDYLAAGRPIATNDVGDLGATVRREEVGIVTRPEPVAFADGIRELLSDPERRRQMGVRARTLAETRFSWHTVARSVADLYDELLS